MGNDTIKRPRRLAIVPKQVLRMACVGVVPAFLAAGCDSTYQDVGGGSGGSGATSGGGGFGGSQVIVLAVSGFGGFGGGTPIALAVGGFSGNVIMLGSGGFAGRPADDGGVDDDGGFNAGGDGVDQEDAG